MQGVASACVLVLIVLELHQGIFATKPRILPDQSWKSIEDGVYQIQEGDELRIKCQGEGELRFSTQNITGNIQQSQHQIIIEPGTGTYTFIHPSTIPEDTGWYACAKKGIVIKNDEQTIDHPSKDISWIYVYVNCKQASSPFAVMHAEDFPNVVVIAEGKAVIPCRPTSPGLKVILHKNFAPEPVGPNLSYDPKIGFIMNYVDGAEDSTSVECGVEDIDLESKPFYNLVVKNNDRLSNTHIKTDKWLRIARGQSLTLHCNITVMKDTTVALDWKTPNSGAEDRSSLESTFSKAGEMETRRIDLTIMNAVESDAGEYTCVAEGAIDTVRSSTHVTILDPNKPFINWTVEGHNNSIVESENATAKWQIYINTYPAAKLDWYKDEILIENVGSHNSSKYSISVDHITYMYKISGLNISDNGNYTIRITTSNGSDVIPLQLTVNVKPLNVIHNRSLLYKPGDTAVLSCNATGSPRPDVKWTFSEWTPKANVESTLPPNITSIPDRRGAFSVLSNITMPIRSMGNLTCTACNTVGCTNVTEPLFVSDGDGFFGIVNRGLQSVTEGDNLTLICAASVFNYTDNLKWVLKNSTGPEPSDSRISFEKKKTNFTWRSILHIRNVSQSDAGKYTCETPNNEGYSEKETYLLRVEVARVPEFNYTNMNNSEISIDLETEKNKGLTLDCRADGRPIPKITWSKNNELLNESTEYRFSQNNTRLQIVYFFDADTYSGTYACKAENRIGTVQRYMEIIFTGKSDSTTLWISLICVAIAIIIIAIAYKILKARRKKILYKSINQNCRFIRNARSEE